VSTWREIQITASSPATARTIPMMARTVLGRTVTIRSCGCTAYQHRDLTGRLSGSDDEMDW
jgi:hypothetical protein